MTKDKMKKKSDGKKSDLRHAGSAMSSMENQRGWSTDVTE